MSIGKYCATKSRLAYGILVALTFLLAISIPGYGQTGQAVTQPVATITKTDAIVASIPVEKCPAWIAVNPTTNRIYVINFDSGSVSIIDGATNKVVKTIPIGENPCSLAVNEVTNRIYVGHATDNTISVVDGNTNALLTNITVNSPVSRMTLNSVANRAYLANDDEGTLSILDLKTNMITAKTGIDTMLGLVVNPVTDRVYASIGNRMCIVAGKTNTIIEKLPLGNMAANCIAINPVTNLLYLSCYNQGKAGSVKVFSEKTNEIVATVPVGKGPLGITVNSITNQVYICNITDNTVSILDGITNTIIGMVPVTLRGSMPSDIAVNPTTNRVYVTNPSTKSVSVLDGNAFLTDEEKKYAAITHTPTNGIPNKFEESFVAEKLDPARWLVMGSDEFPGSTIDIKRKTDTAGSLRLCLDMRKSKDLVRKVHGVRTQDTVIDFEKTTEVNYMLDWNSDANSNNMAVGVYFSPEKPKLPQTDARNYLAVRYCGSPYGPGARLEVSVRVNGIIQTIYDENFSANPDDFEYRKISLQQIRISVDQKHIDVWENGKQICHYEFINMKKLNGPLPWTPAYLFIQQECDADQPMPQEVFISNISVNQVPEQPEQH